MLGLSQAKFAGLLGVSVDTLQNWEQGRRKPTGAACVLLRIAAKNPGTALAEAEAALGGKGRVLLRYSGTEPKIRLLIEGHDQAGHRVFRRPDRCSNPQSDQSMGRNGCSRRPSLAWGCNGRLIAGFRARESLESTPRKSGGWRTGFAINLWGKTNRFEGAVRLQPRTARRRGVRGLNDRPLWKIENGEREPACPTRSHLEKNFSPRFLLGRLTRASGKLDLENPH